MSLNYSSPWLLKLRRLGQRLGVLRPMVRMYRRAFNTAYEEKFDREILNRIAPGDVVWDIGANVGFFTRKFAEKVGEQGKVLAFEPSPTTFSVLRERCSDLRNVEFVNIALADADGTAQFVESGTPADPTNGLYRPGSDVGGGVEVPVRRGDSLCAGRRDIVPNRIKLDVEGYEKEVLEGLSETLRLPEVRDIFVEVHFGILVERGFAQAPTAIDRLLTSCGYQVQWIDPSHLVASRVG